MYADTAAAAREWLAAADPSPDHARRWWDAKEIALLPLGVKWDAVKIDADRGQRALHAGALDGPVIFDPGGQVVYVLVPVGTSQTWDLDGTECLGDTCYLTIPAPQRTSLPGLHWIERHAPDGTGLLADPAALRAALLAAA